MNVFDTPKAPTKSVYSVFIARLMALGVVASTVAGCAEPIKFDDTAEELVARIEKDGPKVPLAAAIEDREPSENGSLVAYAKVVSENTPSVRAARREVLAAQERVAELKRGFGPQVSVEVRQTTTDQEIIESSNPSFEGNQSQYDSLDSSLIVRQRLVDLAASADVAAVRAELRAREAEFAEAQQDAFDEVLRLTLDASEALERYRLAAAEVRYYAARSDSERDAVSAGEMRASKQSETRAQMARARSEMRISAADYRIRVDRLCRLSSAAECPLPQAVSLSQALPQPQPLTAEEIAAVAESPAQLALQASTDAALREVDRARMGMRPRLALELEARMRDRGGSLFDGSSETQTVDLGLVFEWDLFTSGSKRSAIRRELNEALSVDLQREARLREGVGTLETAHSALMALWQNDRALATVVGLQAQALGEVRKEQAAGGATSVDVQSAWLELTRLETLRQRTRRSFVAATVARERATGNLNTATIELVERVLSDGRLRAQVYGMRR